jgi:hypothetical protein
MVHQWRVRMRFGRLTRKPLDLLCLQFSGDALQCDWIVRPLDDWDKDLPSEVADGREAAQALEDALAVRELLFFTVPGISKASLRAYRAVQGQEPELIIAGTVTKPEPIRWMIQSIVMHAKLCGFQFSLNDGRLEALRLN